MTIVAVKSKIDEAKKQYEIINSPYKENPAYELYKYMGGYVPMVDYCKFRPREEKEE